MTAIKKVIDSSLILFVALIALLFTSTSSLPVPGLHQRQISPPSLSSTLSSTPSSTPPSTPSTTPSSTPSTTPATARIS
ncbi:5293_t:CDS:2, partial [Paraglomus occultum]